MPSNDLSDLEPLAAFLTLNGLRPSSSALSARAYRSSIEVAQMTCGVLRRELRSKALADSSNKAREAYLKSRTYLGRAFATIDPSEFAPALARLRRWLDDARLAEAEARICVLQPARYFAFMGCPL